MSDINSTETPKSGYPGVRWDAKGRKWIARIKHKGQNVYLGRFTDIRDAIYAREVGEVRFRQPHPPVAYVSVLDPDNDK